MNQRHFWVFLMAAALCLAALPLGAQSDTKGESGDAEAAASETKAPGKDEAIVLFNGENFEGWKLFVPDEEFDVTANWSVQDGVVDCKGQPAGYMRTTTAYENYVLTLEWRFPGEPGNSGVLLHIQEPDQVWPKSIEAQLHHTDAGDFWVIGGADFDEHTDKTTRRVVKRHASSEKSLGEWNQYRIVCKGDSIKVAVNGVVQNEATGCTISKGYIGLQSEGRPIQFRNIVIQPISE